MSKSSRITLGLLLVAISLTLMINAGEGATVKSGTGKEGLMDVFDYTLEVNIYEEQGNLMAKILFQTTPTDTRFGTYTLRSMTVEYGGDEWKITTDLENSHIITIGAVESFTFKQMEISIEFTRYFVIEEAGDTIKESFWIRYYSSTISTLITGALILGALLVVVGLFFTKEKEGSGFLANAASKFMDDTNYDLIYHVERSGSAFSLLGILLFAVPFIGVPVFMMSMIGSNFDFGPFIWGIGAFFLVFFVVVFFIFSRMIKGALSEQYIYISDTELVRENVFLRRHQVKTWNTQDIIGIIRSKTFHTRTSTNSEGRRRTSSYYLHEILLEVATYVGSRESSRIDQFMALREQQRHIVDDITRSLHDYGFDVRLENVSMNLGRGRSFDRGQERVCPQCGAKANHEDEFCMKCGAALD